MSGEIFNVLHSNYQIRELAMLVAGSVQLLGRTRRARGDAAPKLTRDYECSNAKLVARARLHPAPLGGRGGDRPARRASTTRTARRSPTRAHYNIRWLELLHELKPQLERFGSVL